ncbi:MAG: helix-turn-helix domain-containing protein [Aeromonas veronii]
MTRLRQERLRRRLTIIEVAEAVGVNQSNLSRIEHGQTPSQAVARALFKFYRGRVALGDVYDPLFRLQGAQGEPQASDSL